MAPAPDQRQPDEGAAAQPLRGPRRAGRRVAQGLYYALVLAIAVAAMVQITRQVFFAGTGGESAPYDSCQEGLEVLYAAIGSARVAAHGQGTDAEVSDDEAALIRYRAALAPAWQHRDAVAEMCRGKRLHTLLDIIERLRYSEEHDVRHQASELSTLRRRVRSMVESQLHSRQGEDASVKQDPAHPAPRP